MGQPRAVALPRHAGGVWLVVLSMCSVQFGAGFAGGLIDEVGPAAVVLMRQGFAAVVLLAVCRPRLRGRSREQWTTAAAFGLILATMNMTFYSAVERLPLGVAVTIELLGPLTLSAAMSRRRREFAFVGLALLGVVLLGEGGTALDPVGVLFALIAAAGWASYILVSRRAGQQSSGVDGLAVAMAIAALAVAPAGLRAGTTLLRPHVLAIGIVVALLAALVPFSLELVALRAVPPRVFGVLMSLSPVAAALSGALLLGQRLGGVQLVAMALVVVASVGTVLGEGSGSPSPEPVPLAVAADDPA